MIDHRGRSEKGRDLSLVVATRDRAHRLPTTLEHMAEVRSDHDWELVLVDNGSSDDTASVVRDFTGCAPMPVRYVYEPEPGLGRAINVGARASSGAIIATTDDDCYPRTDYVDAVISAFRTHRIGYLGGRVRLWDTSDADISTIDREDPILFPAPTFIPPGHIGGANLAFRRELFVDIGGFDDDLGLGTPFPCEDAEFCARASNRGWHGAYFPEPTVYHDHRRRPGPEAAATQSGYARARGAYYAKTLLDFPPLRIDCLKWWYWSWFSPLSLAGGGQELRGAAQYFVHRIRRALRSRATPASPELSVRGEGDRSE